MTSLARAILEHTEANPGLRLIYGDATGPNTVIVAGSTVAVTLPALAAVVDGDYVAILEAGGDRLILGAVT